MMRGYAQVLVRAKKIIGVRPLRSIYQLKVSLKGCRSPIWRRLHVASTDSLENIHQILQVTMGWYNEHLHQFVKGRTVYGSPDEAFESDTMDEADFRLDQVLKAEKDKLFYEYDFADGWLHEIVLEKILPFDTQAILPVCIKGLRACPPEDIGGVCGYDMFLDITADPSHPDYEAMLEWVGEDFDAELFDLKQVNDFLREYCD